MPHGAEKHGHVGGDGDGQVIDSVSGSDPAVAGESGLPAVDLAQAAAEAIGSVEATDGSVEVVRPDGTRLALTEGDPLFQGDTIETGPGAAIGVIFLDDTTFSLGAEGQVVLDEMIYDPGTETGVFHANMVRGVFSFVSGQIAKTAPEGMTVTTPVAAIGIRGTKLVGKAAEEGSENTFTMLPETNAQGVQTVGEVTIAAHNSNAPPVVLNSIGATVQMTSSFAPPPPVVVFSQAQIQQSFGSAVLSILPPSPAAGPAGEGPAGAGEGE
ncbi:MAG: FecR domain-containing protein, partial [Rhodospirillales bacterium]|nr:FecR domain-containing protein [Rhodospirillales bacterium]